jgi:hypothetical protein
MMLHVAVPAAVARIGYPQHWQRAWLVMLAAMAIDLDHLLADPIFDPNRCGIGFHPLHSYIAIAIYAAMLAVPRWRIVAIGLLIHIGLDASDCLWQSWE